MTQIEDLTLLKLLGKGSFGEVYLSTKRGRNEYFATKKMNRAQADQPSIRKYFENEIRILDSLRHPNIVRLEELKQTKDYYYIVMEYINGGSLTDCLKKYQKKYGRAFPEEIVQYLMNQIVDAIRYIHSKKIIHRDLKLDNIMVHFDNENDKNNLNMMRARIKIIDFGFAIRLTKANLAFSALGSPINMDPKILKKFNSRGGNINQLGYDYKADIWSLGTICYEMLIGQAVFNAETMNELVKKVETGSYSVPTTVSKEMVSFLNGMLQYDGNNRLSADELAKHPFLTKRVSDFSKINTKQVSRKVDNKGLNINVKQNQTIWAIFNEEDEKRLVNIKGGRDYPAPDGPISEDATRNKRSKTETNIPRIPYNQQNNNNNYHKSNTNQYPNLSSFSSGSSFYGQNMHPSNYGAPNPMQGMNQRPQIQSYPGMQQRPMMPGMMSGIQPGMQPGMQPRMQPGMQPGMQPRMQPGMMSGMQPGMQPGMMSGMQPGMQPGMMSGMQPGMQPRMQPGIQPGMQMPNMGGYNRPPMNYPTFGVPMGYSSGGGIYSNNTPPPNYSGGFNQNSNAFKQYAPYNDEDDDEEVKGNICSIQ